MNILSVYQTVYTVLFVLAGVFLAMAVVFFFLFRIQNVYENLYGSRIGKKKSVSTAAVRSVGKRSQNSKETTDSKTTTKTIKQNNETVPMNGTATVMTRFLETVMIDEEPSELSTEPMGDKSQPLIMTSDSAKQKLNFKPEVKILEFSAKDQI
jgi:hypothetical protein